MKKKITILLFVLFILGSTTAYAEDTYAAASPISSAIFADKGDTIMPMSDAIVWKFQQIDGKTYRRRYNVTKGQWIGDWELVP